jgi:hypothetical protein
MKKKKKKNILMLIFFFGRVKKKRVGEGRGFIKQGHDACVKVANQKDKYLF